MLLAHDHKPTQRCGCVNVLAMRTRPSGCRRELLLASARHDGLRQNLPSTPEQEPHILNGDSSHFPRRGVIYCGTLRREHSKGWVFCTKGPFSSGNCSCHACDGPTEREKNRYKVFHPLETVSTPLFTRAFCRSNSSASDKLFSWSADSA